MNVAIGGPHLEHEIAALVFDGELYTERSATHIPDLLFQLEIYKSRSEARRAGREGAIPAGYSELRASKLVPRLCIWNPLQARDRAWMAQPEAKVTRSAWRAFYSAYRKGLGSP